MPRATSRGRCGVAEVVTSRLGGVARPLYPGLCGVCGPVRKRIAYSFAGSAEHRGRLRRNREESTAGDMWRPVRTPPPHALDRGSDSTFRILRRGLSLYPEVLDPTQARALPIDPKALENSQISGSPFFSSAFRKTQHHLTLTSPSCLCLSSAHPSDLPGRLLCTLYLLLGGRQPHDSRCVSTPWLP